MTSQTKQRLDLGGKIFVAVCAAFCTTGVGYLVSSDIDTQKWRAATDANRFSQDEWTDAKDWIDRTFLTLPSWSDRIKRNETGIDTLSREVRTGFEKLDTRLDSMAETLAELRAERIKGT